MQSFPNYSPHPERDFLSPPLIMSPIHQLCAFLSHNLRTKYWCRIIEARLGFFPQEQICTNSRRAISPRCHPKTNWCDGPHNNLFRQLFFSLPTRFRCYFLFFRYFCWHSHLVAGGRVSCQWWLQRSDATPRASCTCCKSPPTK